MIQLLPRHRQIFWSVLADLADDEAAAVEAIFQSAATAAIEAAGHKDYAAPARRVDLAAGRYCSSHVKRGLIAKWMLGLPDRVSQEALPQTVLDLYPFWIEEFANWLSTQRGRYDDDHWAKDVRFALALSVPGNRTQTIDLVSYCRPGQILRHAVLRADLRTLLRYLACGGWHRKWLQTHTESRHLHDFHETGWDRLWSTAADICMVRTDLAGMVGSSWFFDPPLDVISPRLSYLRHNPEAGGAFTADQGSSRTHCERASATSPTRRAMIADGTYTPHSWLLAWPRRSLLAWAADYRRRTAATMSGDLPKAA